MNRAWQHRVTEPWIPPDPRPGPRRAADGSPVVVFRGCTRPPPGPDPRPVAGRGVATGRRADRPAPDPLDDATYEFPTGRRRPLPLRPLRRAPPRPAPPSTPARRTPHPLSPPDRRWSLWSVVDLWAFVAALRLGPGPLAPVALAGTVATCWHLRTVVAPAHTGGPHDRRPQSGARRRSLRSAPPPRDAAQRVAATAITPAHDLLAPPRAPPPAPRRYETTERLVARHPLARHARGRQLRGGRCRRARCAQRREYRCTDRDRPAAPRRCGPPRRDRAEPAEPMGATRWTERPARRYPWLAPSSCWSPPQPGRGRRRRPHHRCHAVSTTTRRHRHRPRRPRPPARRHGHRLGDSGHRGRVPRCRPPLRHDPVEPRHHAQRRPVRRGLRRQRHQHRRLQPHPPQRHRMPLVPGRADSAHRRCRGHRPRVGQPALLARRTSRRRRVATRWSSIPARVRST